MQRACLGGNNSILFNGFSREIKESSSKNGSKTTIEGAARVVVLRSIFWQDAFISLEKPLNMNFYPTIEKIGKK